MPDEDRIHAVGRDVTVEKEAAQTLSETEEALRQAQKMEAVGQLTGGIAHDFNNLLTGIVGSLDLMQTRIAQGRFDVLEKYAKAAMSSANRAAALTHRLLAFARRQPLDPKPVNANTLVTSLDDEAVVRDLIVEVLAELGYRALEAQDGPSGLKLLQSRERIDLLVTDVGLPGLNGRQLADQARESRPELKVLFITGYAENAMFGSGHLSPGMEMITKPFPVEALATREMIEE